MYAELLAFRKKVYQACKVCRAWRQYAIIKIVHLGGGAFKGNDTHCSGRLHNAVIGVEGVRCEYDAGAWRHYDALTVKNNVVKAFLDLHQLVKVVQLSLALLARKVEMMQAV